MILSLRHVTFYKPYQYMNNRAVFNKRFRRFWSSTAIMWIFFKYNKRQKYKQLKELLLTVEC